MTYRGRIKNGVVVLDSPATLPEGVEVQVIRAGEDQLPPTWAEAFKDITGKAEGLPADMARNHDHYLHGAPKKMITSLTDAHCHWTKSRLHGMMGKLIGS